MFAGFAVIAQLAIVAHAPDSAFACDAVEVSVAISAPARSFPRLIAPSFAPFDLLRNSNTPHLDFDARSSLLADWQREGEPLAVAGQQRAVVDSAERPVAII